MSKLLILLRMVPSAVFLHLLPPSQLPPPPPPIYLRTLRPTAIIGTHSFHCSRVRILPEEGVVVYSTRSGLQQRFALNRSRVRYVSNFEFWLSKHLIFLRGVPSAVLCFYSFYHPPSCCSPPLLTSIPSIAIALGYSRRKTSDAAGGGILPWFLKSSAASQRGGSRRYRSMPHTDAPLVSLEATLADMLPGRRRRPRRG